MQTVCAGCGSPYVKDQSGALCPDCRPTDTGSRERVRGTRTERGYDNVWLLLSARARKLQPWCTDCGSSYDLTADHSEKAWERREQGKAIRLKDIDVVCRRCNTERGAARGDNANDQWREMRNLPGANPQ